MGILDSIESMAGGQNQQVTGGLMQELSSQPGGLAGIVSHFQNNGQGAAAQSWAQGNTAPASPDQIQQGLGGGMIDSISQRTGVSPTMVKMGLAAAVPFLIHHLAQNGHIDGNGQPTGTTPDSSNVLSSIMSHL